MPVIEDVQLFIDIDPMFLHLPALDLSKTDVVLTNAKLALFANIFMLLTFRKNWWNSNNLEMKYEIQSTMIEFKVIIYISFK